MAILPTTGADNMSNIESIITQAYTVRANRGKARIWIQGKRLAGAGFTPGKTYSVHRDHDSITMRLHGDIGTEVRKVSGKGATPIIDLSGSGCAPFTTGDPVIVQYGNGTIVIRRA